MLKKILILIISFIFCLNLNLTHALNTNNYKNLINNKTLYSVDFEYEFNDKNFPFKTVLNSSLKEKNTNNLICVTVKLLYVFNNFNILECDQTKRVYEALFNDFITNELFLYPKGDVFFVMNGKELKKFYKTIKELDFSKINIKQSDFENAKILIKNFIKNKIADIDHLKKQIKYRRNHQLNNICEKQINNLNHHIKEINYLKFDQIKKSFENFIFKNLKFTILKIKSKLTI